MTTNDIIVFGLILVLMTVCAMLAYLVRTVQFLKLLKQKKDLEQKYNSLLNRTP